MNKELRRLLDEINQKKAEVRTLAEAGKLDEAAEAKKELETMQNKFDILKEVMDEAEPATAEPVKKVPAGDPVNIEKEFANAVRKLRFMNYNNEGQGIDGGYTVPQDIQTRINRYKEDKFSLERLISKESVTTNTGRRTYQKRSQHTGFSKVAESGKIGLTAGPQFDIVNYAIDKFAGYLPVTNELLEDSDANITAVLVQWLGEEDIATKNREILAKVETKTKTPFTGLDDIKYALNVTLGQAFAPTSSIITNDDGLNYLDTLKVSATSDEYLLKPAQDQTQPIKMYIAIGGRIVPVVVVPNSVFASGTGASDHVLAPFVVGDLKEYVKLFDRKRITLLSSNVTMAGSGNSAVNAFEQDLTLIRGIERFDTRILDEDSIVYGQIDLG